MEYPTLYRDLRRRDADLDAEVAAAERVSGVFTSVHEFGHRYFQGLFASRRARGNVARRGHQRDVQLSLVYWDALQRRSVDLSAARARADRQDMMIAALLGTGDRDKIDP